MRARELTLHVWDESGTAVYDPLFLLVSSVRKGSQYPGGLYGPASFVLPFSILKRPGTLRPGFEVRLLDGGALIYHGWVDGVEEMEGAARGALVSCVGAWGRIMVRRGIERNWADTRLDGGAWVEDTTANGAEYATTDRKDRLRITPKGVQWATDTTYYLEYNAPTGETIGRVTDSYDFQEAAQTWRLRLYDPDAAAAAWSYTASASGTDAVTLAAAATRLQLQFSNLLGAPQTPTEGGTYYGQVADLVLYASRNHASATLGNVSAYEIALDIVDLLGVDENSISASVEDIGTTLTLSLVPFVTNGYESFASILARAASYGDSSQNSIGFGLRSPFVASDNLPRLFVETYPDLTDYDYETTAEECGVKVRVNVDDVYNWIVVEYTNRLGITQTITPDDDSSLTDATSVATYGKRIQRLSLPLANDQLAAAFGGRYLARHKDPTYAVTRPPTVSRVRIKNGGYLPASQIDAGMRLRILDLQNFNNQQSPGGVTFLITATNYDHDRRMAQLSLGGAPDSLDVLLSQMSLGNWGQLVASLPIR